MTGELERGVWQRFDHDPRLPAHQPLRAGDRDRDVVGEVLTQAYAEGRLDRDELDERQDRLRAARTLGELPVLVQDLVPDRGPARPTPPSMRAEAEAKYQQRLRSALSGFLVPTLICWVVWLTVLLAGGGTAFPWPLFVTLGTSVGLVGVLTKGKEPQVAEIERHLQERALRREERRQRRLGRGPGGGPGDGQAHTG